MTNQRHPHPLSAARRLLCAVAALACSAPALADPSTMFLQYELAHGRGRVEHTLSLAWAPPPDATGRAAEAAAGTGLRLPLFTTAAGRAALFNAAPPSEESPNQPGFGEVMLSVLIVAATLAAVAASVDEATDDFLDHIDIELPPVVPPPPPPAPPAVGGG